MNERVILVNEFDEVIGESEKLPAHIEGVLHRAFSVFLFDSSGRVMLQKRAYTKYHSGGLWSNTCCGHPRPGEKTEDAAHRRLNEEMGIDCPLSEVFSFLYTASMGSDLIENEFDHVFFGLFNAAPVLNRREVESWAWMDVSALRDDIRRDPARYSFWLRALIFRELLCSKHAFAKS